MNPRLGDTLISPSSPTGTHKPILWHPVGVLVALWGLFPGVRRVHLTPGYPVCPRWGHSCTFQQSDYFGLLTVFGMNLNFLLSDVLGQLTLSASLTERTFLSSNNLIFVLLVIICDSCFFCHSKVVGKCMTGTPRKKLSSMSIPK